MTTAPLDPIQLLAAQLQRIEESIKALPALCEQLENVGETTRDLEMALRETTTELRMRDEAQAKSIEDLRLRQHETLAGVTVLSNGMQEIRGEMAEMKGSYERLEQQVKALFDTERELSRKVRELEERKSVPALNGHLKDFEATRDDMAALEREVAVFPKIELRLKEIEDLLPWVKAMKWVLLAALAVVVVWATKVLIEVIVHSGVMP